MNYQLSYHSIIPITEELLEFCSLNLKTKMDDKGDKQLFHMIEIEKKAEEIIVDKNDIISLDKTRNLNRESLRAVEKSKKSSLWMMFGSSMIKLPKDKVRSIIDSDLVATNVEINKKRSDLKIKVNDLRDLEYEEKYSAFYLNPLSHKELSALFNEQV